MTGGDVVAGVRFNQVSAHPGLSNNAANGVITCVEAGTYFFSFSFYTSGTTAAHEGCQAGFYKNGAFWFKSWLYSIDHILGGHHVACGIPLEVGDTVQGVCRIGGSTVTADIGGDPALTQIRAIKLD